MVCERRLNQISTAIPKIRKTRNSKPAIRARPKSDAISGAGLNHNKLTAKNKTTVMLSYRRSTMIVTKAAAGLTRLSRIAKTTGRTISPARPIVSTAPNPTVVAIQTSRRLAFVKGVRNARHRIALHK